MNSQNTQILSKVILSILALIFLYIVSKALSTVNRRHIGTDDGIYINSTNSSPYIQELASKLTNNCQSNQCRVQNVLDYVTNIPYKVNHFQAHSPQQTIQKNFGDCDDKSNLLISLLHELNIESYFVLVPRHIFVIVSAKDIDLTPIKEGLFVNHQKFYILESTAKDSLIGFSLRYELNEIRTIIEPFSNKKIDIVDLEWKL